MTQGTATLSRPKKKLFYRINEVSELTDIKPHVLRYWETEFTELSPEKDASDHRRYRAKDIRIIQTIIRLLYKECYTIKGARQRLKTELRRNGSNRKNGATSPSARARNPKVSVLNDSAPISRPCGRSGATVQQTLGSLRREVDELLKMLR